MKRDHLNNCLLLYFRKSITDILNTVDIAKTFICANEQRKRHFGKYEQSKGPFTQAIFVAATRCNFCRAQGCNFKTARKPGAIFSAICRRDIAGVASMFET